MLAVVAPTAAAITATTTTTTTATSAFGLQGLVLTRSPYLPPVAAEISKNSSRAVLVQGDQPAHPVIEGTPVSPSFWRRSHRALYLNNRYGRYLEMWPDGNTRGVPSRSSFCIFVMLSHLSHVVMKGYMSDRYLCMNPSTYHLYTRNHVHRDCFIQDAIRGTSIVYSFSHCRTPEKEKCYLDMYPNGTMRLATEGTLSRSTAQWLAIEVDQQELIQAEHEKVRMKEQGDRWTPPPLPTPVTPKEQRRKRVRRWCRNLDIIVKNPRKFRRRCKHDCEILERMIRQPKRYMRRCLTAIVRRRMRSKSQSGAASSPSGLDAARVRAKVQQLWPQRKAIFRRLRQIRRCNKKKQEKRKEQKVSSRKPRKHSSSSSSCSVKDIRREEKRRVERRKRTKAESRALDSVHKTLGSVMTTMTSPQQLLRNSRRRIRHPRRKKGGKRRSRSVVRSLPGWGSHFVGNKTVTTASAVVGGTNNSLVVHSVRSSKSIVGSRRKRRVNVAGNMREGYKDVRRDDITQTLHSSPVDMGRRERLSSSVDIATSSQAFKNHEDIDSKNSPGIIVKKMESETVSHSSRNLSVELT